MRTPHTHEAAHVVVVARYFGYHATAAVWPSGESDYLTSKLWVGRSSTYGHPLKEGMRIIGLAGGVGVLLLRDPDLQEREVEELLECETDGVSDTDQAAFSGHTYEDLDACLDLVRNLWPAITTEAGLLREAAVELQRRRAELRKAGEA